ncbi:MAG TPA: DUF2382 domain-containing protein [Allosphingosinicella sp.]|jgi:uncharacterized protein (TIGR02271 family)
MREQEEVAAIPLVEERVSIAKRQVESERLHVRIAVHEREERVPVELAQDEVEVERVPRNVAISELPLVRHEGNTTIIPVVEEVVVLEKRMVLVEEIHVRRVTATTTEHVPVVIRSEEASIDRQSAESRGPAGRGAQ